MPASSLLAYGRFVQVEVKVPIPPASLKNLLLDTIASPVREYVTSKRLRPELSVAGNIWLQVPLSGSSDELCATFIAPESKTVIDTYARNAWLQRS